MSFNHSCSPSKGSPPPVPLFPGPEQHGSDLVLAEAATAFDDPDNPRFRATSHATPLGLSRESTAHSLWPQAIKSSISEMGGVEPGQAQV
jgi:hypothetical protein